MCGTWLKLARIVHMHRICTVCEPYVTVFLHRIWPYIGWFPRQKHRICTPGRSGWGRHATYVWYMIRVGQDCTYTQCVCTVYAPLNVQIGGGTPPMWGTWLGLARVIHIHRVCLHCMCTPERSDWGRHATYEWYMIRVGQDRTYAPYMHRMCAVCDRIFTPYMTVYWVISPPETPYVDI